MDDVKMPVVAYLRATKDGEPQWSEDCVCQDPVYPADPDGSDEECISMPMVRQSDALKAIEEANAKHEKLLKDLRWRMDDIRDMLMKEGFDGRRIYGCDEWSTPTVNLQSAIDLIDRFLKESA